MPELPEVETIVRDLDRLVRGSTIRRVEVLRPDLIRGGSPAEFQKRLKGKRIGGVSRRAKNIVFDLGDDRLVVNLGMTGRLLATEAGDGEEEDYLGVRFDLDGGRRMLYRDVRRFGRLEVVDAPAWDARQAELGIEPLGTEFTPELLYELSRASRVAVKTWLMDQKRVVGVGNIYANEALFRAGIDPRKPANSLTRPRARRLAHAIQEVLREAIDFRGTTLLDYRDASGQQGEFSRRLRVYDRKGEPCVTCGTPIRRIVQGGRSTFFCPKCQR
jgi:formamidopyrimidine-DNA glycosylase